MGRKGRNTPGASGSQRRSRGAPGAQGGLGRRSGRNKASTGTYSAEDFDSLVRQLEPMALAVRKMDTDGNCLYRAFADQVCGDCEEHMAFRENCCNHLLKNAEEFALFHADEDFDGEDEAFEDYVERMRSPGVWGSQLELMALCQTNKVNAIVHQAGMSAYEMVFAPTDARCVQLSYHDGEHYNSVRLANDMAPGQPARWLSLDQIHGNPAAPESEEVLRVRELLPPPSSHSAAAIRLALAQTGDDVEAAAELLITQAMAADVSDRAAEPSAAACRDDANTPGDGVSHSDGDSRPSRAQKRDVRRRDKQVAEDKRRKARGSAQSSVHVDPSDLPDEEALSLLTKQLLTV